MNSTYETEYPHYIHTPNGFQCNSSIANLVSTKHPIIRQRVRVTSNTAILDYEYTQKLHSFQKMSQWSQQNPRIKAPYHWGPCCITRTWHRNGGCDIAQIWSTHGGPSHIHPSFMETSFVVYVEEVDEIAHTALTLFHLSFVRLGWIPLYGSFRPPENSVNIIQQAKEDDKE